MSDPRPLIIGVPPRGLARTQAENLAEALVGGGRRFPIHLEIVEEPADVTSALHDDHIAENRSSIRRLHRLLEDGSIDVVLHRGFDLRGDVPDGLRIMAVLDRAKPFEVMISPQGDSLDTLEDFERLGAVHLRTRAQVLEYRPELEVELVRGDAGDWLTAMIDGRVDALIAPGAAIEEMGLQAQVSEIFPPEMIVPGPGAGILVCLGRRDDLETADRMRALHSSAASAEYAAECALVESLGGSWEMPIAVLARLQRREMVVQALVAAPDGTEILREEHAADADDPCRAGVETAALLLDRGADRLLGDGDDDVHDIVGRLPGAEFDSEADWETEVD